MPRRPEQGCPRASRSDEWHGARRFRVRLHEDVGGPVYDLDMGRVIDLATWRESRERDPVLRLERAVARLEAQLQRGTGRIGPRVEAELQAITGAMTGNRQEEAAERAERLAERLEHPSARLSS